ncbi:MAG: class I SAM-dependent methyltransferase [Chloroflexota bacterium]
MKVTTPASSRDFYNTIARYYDAENEEVTADLELYSALAADTAEALNADAPILDVGCGTGRVMLHLAGEGYQMRGVDSSVAMLERGKRKAKNRIDLADMIKFYEGNALDFAFPEKYGLILIPYNGFMHFNTAADQRNLLHYLYNWLLDDGLLAIDLPNAGETFGTIDDGAVTLERSFVEPESGHMVMQQSVSALNRTDQLQRITWIYDEIHEGGMLQRTVAPLTLRYVFPTEMDLLLELNGFERIARYGDYDQSPFEEGCERLIVVARKNAARRR